MTRRFNFGAGPAAIPDVVLEEVQQELLDWKGMGLSVMEISHRSPEFIEIAKQAELDFRDLLDITDSYAVLFLHGGATLQNAMMCADRSHERHTTLQCCGVCVCVCPRGISEPPILGKRLTSTFETFRIYC